MRMRRSQVATAPQLPTMRDCMGFLFANPLTVEEHRRAHEDDEIIMVFEGLHNEETRRGVWQTYIDEIGGVEDIVKYVTSYTENILRWGAAYYQIMMEKYEGKV